MKARVRLDSASVGLDLADRIAGTVLDRSARYLGARPVDTSRELRPRRPIDFAAARTGRWCGRRVRVPIRQTTFDVSPSGLRR